jgi:DUF1680 family protein
MDALEVARSGAVCLAGLVKKDGSFNYRYDSQSGGLLAGYNVLRHAGAVWSMLDVYRSVADAGVLEGGRKAIHHLLDSYLRFFRSCNNACICEDNKIKLGGNALSILALLSLYELTGERFLLSIAEQLGHFITSQRTKSGELVHKRYFESGKISDFHSLYYTGEGLLALLALYQATGEKSWLDAVLAMESVLAIEEYGVEEQSHWMLYTLELLANFHLSPECYCHAEKIVLHILDHPEYLHWQRSTPIACRSEGLLAFLSMPRPDGIDDKKLNKRCLLQVKENLKLQLDFRLSDGSFVRGGNDQRRNEVRIDYIQHNISSFLHFDRLSLNDVKSNT